MKQTINKKILQAPVRRSLSDVYYKTRLGNVFDELVNSVLSKA